jgi:hypothetical protein
MAEPEIWSTFSQQEERDFLIGEGHESSRQTVTIVGFIIGLISLTVVPALHRYHVFTLSGHGNAGAWVAAFSFLFACGMLYVALLTIAGGVGIDPVSFDDAGKARISIRRLNERLKAAYRARGAAIALLFGWPMLLVMNYIITIKACTDVKC